MTSWPWICKSLRHTRLRHRHEFPKSLDCIPFFAASSAAANTAASLLPTRIVSLYDFGSMFGGRLSLATILEKGEWEDLGVSSNVPSFPIKSNSKTDIGNLCSPPAFNPYALTSLQASSQLLPSSVAISPDAIKSKGSPMISLRIKDDTCQSLTLSVFQSFANGGHVLDRHAGFKQTAIHRHEIAQSNASLGEQNRADPPPLMQATISILESDDDASLSTPVATTMDQASGTR
jgi:hypothetical protein